MQSWGIKSSLSLIPANDPIYRLQTENRQQIKMLSLNAPLLEAACQEV